MSATLVRIDAAAIENPDFTGNGDGDESPPHDPQTLPNGLGYSSSTSDIRTLSSHGSNGKWQSGLLYTPDLEAGDACIAESEPYVRNTTRIADLPPKYSQYLVMAIAPWISAECSLNYMIAARNNPYNRGFLFYLPNNSSQAPPDQNDPIWHVDGEWKNDNGFPVYAIAGSYGAEIMLQTSKYRGNVTDVPHGHELIEDGVQSTDYVRVFADIDTVSTSSLPSLWVFLLIVLAVLLAIIALTSLSMHLIQRRRRRSLRRRVASGEVDLEALGIKRLTVPQHLLNQMPVYTYGTSTSQIEDPARSLEEKEFAVDASDSPPTSPRPTLAHLRSHSFRPTALSQPTCPICLEDFELANTEHEGSTVRELPCHHIFHPECVDSFLRTNSSLCPMCKKTTLPKGYCPRVVTNAMVRRERVMRRIRVNLDTTPTETRESSGYVFRQRLRSIPGFGRRASHAPQFTESQRMEELDDIRATTPPPPVGPVDQSQIAGQVPPSQARLTLGQREWRRQRALNLLGRSDPVDPDVEDAQQTPAWKKAVRSVFPGFGR